MRVVLHRVESHSAQSISLPQCAMRQSAAVVSLHHGFQTHDSDVTAQLRVTADFRHCSQRPGTTTERLSIGVDIEVLLTFTFFPEFTSCVCVGGGGGGELRNCQQLDGIISRCTKSVTTS